jgi:hypothetical protein
MPAAELTSWLARYRPPRVRQPADAADPAHT